MSVEALVGHWRNNDSRDAEIVEVRAVADGEGLRIALRSREGGDEVDWPSVRCEVFAAAEEDATPGAAALGVVELDSKEVELQLRVNKGVLCVMTWTRFCDGSRQDYVIRELFARVDAPGHPFVGTWLNTDESSRGVLRLAFEHDTELRVTAWATPAGAGGPAIDLGRATVELFGGLHDARPIAFAARLGDVLLQGNLNRGLMILAAYRHDVAAAPLAGRFSREFFARHHLDARPPARSTTEGALFHGFTAGEHDDGAPASPRFGPEFVGRWVSTDLQRGDQVALDIRPDGDRLTIEVEGSGRLSGPWPAVAARSFAYVDELGRHTHLLLATCEAAWGRSDLQIKVTGGTAVVAGFHTRPPGSSWFVREFLHRPSPGPRPEG